MTDTPVARSDFYVYALLRGDCTPFYIGVGSGDRWLQHERGAQHRKSHKDHVILKMRRDGWPEIPKVKLAEGLTRPVAAQMEIDLILLLGRRPNGPLTNLTRGGEGVVDLSPETKKKWLDASAAAQRKPEARAKRRAIAIANFPKIRDAFLAARAAHIASRPLAEMQKFAVRLNSPEATAKRAATNRIAEVRDKRVAAQKAAFNTPEALEKRSAASKKFWAERKQEVQEKRNQKRRANPNDKAIRSAAAKKFWAAKRDEVISKRKATRQRNHSIRTGIVSKPDTSESAINHPGSPSPPIRAGSEVE